MKRTNQIREGDDLQTNPINLHMECENIIQDGQGSAGGQRDGQIQTDDARIERGEVTLEPGQPN